MPVASGGGGGAGGSGGTGSGDGGGGNVNTGPSQSQGGEKFDSYGYAMKKYSMPAAPQQPKMEGQIDAAKYQAAMQQHQQAQARWERANKWLTRFHSHVRDNAASYADQAAIDKLYGELNDPDPDVLLGALHSRQNPANQQVQPKVEVKPEVIPAGNPGGIQGKRVNNGKYVGEHGEYKLFHDSGAPMSYREAHFANGFTADDMLQRED